MHTFIHMHIHTYTHTHTLLPQESMATTLSGMHCVPSWADMSHQLRSHAADLFSNFTDSWTMEATTEESDDDDDDEESSDNDDEEDDEEEESEEKPPAKRPAGEFFVMTASTHHPLNRRGQFSCEYIYIYIYMCVYGTRHPKEFTSAPVVCGWRPCKEVTSP